MLLKALYELGQKIQEVEKIPHMYVHSLVHWEIELNAVGDLVAVRALVQETIRKKKVKGVLQEESVGTLGQTRLLPYLSRNGVEPKLISDTAEYVLAMGSERSKNYHHAFKKLLSDCYEETQESPLNAILLFLSGNPEALVLEFLSRAPEQWEIEKEHTITFLIEGKDPTALPAVREFWGKYIDETIIGETLVNQCLITGKVGPTARKMLIRFSGFPDTQATATLISSHCDSFCSYGLKQTENSPISLEAAETFSQGLHYLLRNRKHNRKVGSLLYLFWGVDNIDPMGFLTEPTLDDVNRLLGAPYTGSRPEVKSEDFNLVALSGGGGRIIVRDFLRLPIDKVNESLRKWFSAQQLVDFGGVDGTPLGLYPLLAVAYRDPKKDIQAHELSALTSTALFGTRPSLNLLRKVITRIQAGGPPRYRQCVLIKTILSYHLDTPLMPSLDERLETLTQDSHKTAYCLGRILSLYEAIQWYAVGNVNSSVAERVYSSASTTPSRIFGRLESGAVNNIKTLKRKKPALGAYFEEKIAAIHARIPGASYPNILMLEEQGIFGLGYWQQKCDRKPKEVEEELKSLETEEVATV